jgi:hypothetical protein
MHVQRGSIPSASQTVMRFEKILPCLLQRVENALAKEGKTCPAIAHPFYELEFVHFSFDHPIAVNERESCFHCLLVSFYTSHKALQLADLAGPHLLKPGVELFPRARAEHLRELLDQLICLIHFRMQRSKQRQRFLVLGQEVWRRDEARETPLLARAQGSVEAGWKIRTSSYLLEGNERVACRRCDR